jgi:hypothetical protein
MLFAFYFFVRAKQISPVEKTSRTRRYAASAVSFGLMIASKYFPHYLGLNMLFHHNFHVREGHAHEPDGHTPGWFFIVIIGVFLLASPAVSSSPFWGTPIYFYLLFLAIKVPLLTLVAFLLGLFFAVKKPRHVGHAFLLFMFLFWLVPYSLIGGKWLRYTLSVMPFVYMLAAVGVVGLIRCVAGGFKSSPRALFTTSAIAAVLFVCVPAWTAFAHRPHYALYTNALAADKAGFYFPHDEFYDDGLREGIKYVCEHAPQGATIAHETPGVTRYYLSVFGRTDLDSQVISAREFDVTSAPGTVYVVVQRGRTYFENREELETVRAKFRRVHEVTIDGVTAVEVFINQ